MIFNLWMPRGLCWRGAIGLYWWYVCQAKWLGLAPSNIMFSSWNGIMICWRCTPTTDDNMQYRECSIGAKWKAKRRRPGTVFKAQMLARATVKTLFTCPGFTLDMVCVGIMLCVELGVTQGVWERTSVSTWTTGGLPTHTQKTRCEDV